MAFAFHNIALEMKPTDIKKSKEGVNFIIKDNFTRQGDFFVFLLDRNPIKQELSALNSYIKEFKINNYCILNCVNQNYEKEELKGTGLANFLKQHTSDWEEFIKRKSYPVKAIMAFGCSLYNINGNADILTEDFYADDFVDSWYFSGHQNRKLDTFVFPVDGLKDIFPSNYDDGLYKTNPDRMTDIGSIITCKTRFFKAQLKKMTSDCYNISQVDTREPKFHILTTKKDITEVLNNNMNSDLVAWDIETSGLKFYQDNIVCVTICWDGVNGYYLPFNKIDKELLAKNILSCKHNTGANPKFDTKFLWHNGITKELLPTDAVDMIAHIIHSERSVGLKPLAYLYSSLGGYDNMLDDYKAKTGCKDYSKIPVDILSSYAIMDAIATWRIQKSLEAQMDRIDAKYKNDKEPDWNIRKWYETQCMPIYQEAIRTEYEGIFVSNETMKANREYLEKDIEAKKKKLKSIWNVNQNFNIFSTLELGKLFEKLGFPCHGRTKEGVYATDEDAIEAWIREGMPGIELLKDVRNEKTVVNSFLGKEKTDMKDIAGPFSFGYFGNDEEIEINKKQTGWLNYIHHVDEDDSERIFQSYRVMGTTSFRFIGKDPNFQNVPTRGKYAPYVKRCIDTPKDDLYIITGDSGKEYKLASFEYALTDRGYIQAKDLKESDKLIEDADSPVILKLGIEVEEGKPTQFPEKFWFSDEEV